MILIVHPTQLIEPDGNSRRLDQHNQDNNVEEQRLLYADAKPTATATI